MLYLNRIFHLSVIRFYQRVISVVGLSVLLLACGTEKNTAEKKTYTSTSPSSLPSFLTLPRNEPMDMLNMIRFKELAEYDEDSGFADKGWTGAEAYAEYSRLSQKVIDRLGLVKMTYSGTPAMTLIGPKDELWDVVFVLRYDSVKAFGELMKDPEYQAHKFHKQAAVLDSRLIRLAPAPLSMPQPE